MLASNKENLEDSFFYLALAFLLSKCTLSDEQNKKKLIGNKNASGYFID